jgi:hypothetical protein
MLTVAHLVKKYPPFMEHESLLPRSQESATGTYPEAAESSSHPILCFLKNTF